MDFTSIPRTSESLKHVNVPKHLFLPKGMIMPEEQILFYLLGRDVYSGSGEIVDAGSFCGASTYSFASGINDNKENFERRSRIHAYDLFVVDDGYTKEYIQNNFFYYTNLGAELAFKKADVESGYSFKEVFEFQTQRYSEYINLNAGSITDFEWEGKSIEIFFIDVAKTLDIQKHLFKSFFPYLIPEKGCLIQQDFHHAYHPYIHVAMEFLATYFDITHSKIGASRVYRLKNSVPSSMLQRVVDYDFTKDEVFSLMSQCVKSSPKEERALLLVAFARHLMLNDDARIEGVISEFIELYSMHANFSWYIGQMKSAVGEYAAKILKKLGY